MGMEIKLRPSESDRPVPATCYICGHPFELSDVIAEAYTLDLLLGEVCPYCIRAGTNFMQGRLKSRAEYMHQQAGLMAAAATKINAPSHEDYNRMIAAVIASKN